MHDPTWPYVHVMGRLRVTDVNGVERIPQGEPSRTLLLLLALSGGSVHLEHAIDVLWPGLSVQHGRHRLRNVLTRLHSHCGHLVKREGNTLVLQANTDIAAFTRAIATLLLHAGQEIAPDVRYADWAEAARRRLTVASERLAQLL